MADIFREVDEEMRRERAQDLWRKYGTYILAGAFLVVLATAALVAWREWQERQRHAAGAQLVAATELAAKGRGQEATTALADFAAKADGGYELLARLQEAGLRAKQGDAAGAAAAYESISRSDAPQTYRDLAIILLALNTFDTADPATMIRRLEPITASENPMRFSALELTALFEQKAGNAARASEIYGRLSEDASAPGPMRERAREMLRAFSDVKSARGAS